MSSFQNVDAFLKAFQPLSSSSCTVLHVNIRSIRKHWDEFALISNLLSNTVDVFALTEINVTDDLSSPFCLPGYSKHFLTRKNSRGGGIAVFIKHSLFVSNINIVFSSAEALAFELTKNDLVTRLLVVYRPPSENALCFIEEMREVCRKTFSSGNLCIIGDFNIDLLRSERSAVEQYLNALSEFGIEPLIWEPTREEFLKDNLTRTCIDHVNVRASDLSCAAGAVIMQKLADHYFVVGQLTKSNSLQSGHTHSVTILDKKKFDKKIASFDWNSFILDNNNATAYDNFVRTLGQMKEACKKTVLIKKRRAEHQWLTPGVLALIKEKNMLWARCRRAPDNTALRDEFRTVRNRVTAQIRSSKRQFCNEQFKASSRNMTKTWSLVNQLRGNERLSTKSTIERNFGSVTSDLANKFNESFSLEQNDPVQCAGNNVLPNLVSSSAFIPFLTEPDLLCIVSSLSRSKSLGLDNIHIGDLCRNIGYLKGVILFILNNIIEHCSWPDSLKCARVVPLYKSGKKRTL